MVRALTILILISISQIIFAQNITEIFSNNISAQEIFLRLYGGRIEISENNSTYKMTESFCNFKKGESLSVEDSIYKKYGSIDILIYIIKVKVSNCDSCNLKLILIELMRSQYSSQWVLNSITNVNEPEFFTSDYEISKYDFHDFWEPGYFFSITFHYENGNDRITDYQCLYLNGNRIFKLTSEYHRIEFDEKNGSYLDAAKFSSTFMLDQQKKLLRLHTKGSKYYNEIYKKMMPVDKVEYFSLKLITKNKYEFLPIINNKK